MIVVLGNPPYNRFAGVPLQEEADLVDYFKGITRDKNGKQLGQSLLYSRWGVRKHLLDDLYIRFFRLAEVRIGEKAEFGIISFISNSSYLLGRSHPIMRESLLEDFDTIWIDNLHGNRIASERTPWGQSCETIFNTNEIGPGIKIGTCVSTLLKRSDPGKRSGRVYIRDFWGRAEKKRAALLASLDMQSWTDNERKLAGESPEGPREYLEFPPSEKNGWKFAPADKIGFEDWPAFDDLFPKWFQGVNPNRGLDGSVIDTDESALEARMRDYFSSLSFTDLKKQQPVLCEPRARYKPKETRDRLRKISSFDKSKILPYVLFPLDLRWIYYERQAKFLNESRPDLGDHIAGNEFLVGAPQPRRVSECRPLILQGLFDLHLHDWGSVGFPAEVNPDSGMDGLFKPAPEDLVRTANLSENVWSTLRSAWNLKGDLRGADAKRSSRALFRYCTAIAHSPQYESDHKDSLALGWPHIPVCKDKTEFDEIVKLGDQVVRLLNPLADPALVLKATLGKDAKGLAVVKRIGGGNVKQSNLLVQYSYYGAAPGRWDLRAPAESEVQRPEWGEITGDLYLNQEIFLSHVPEEIWRYELGGYPVLKKWLGYRQANRRLDGPLTLQEVDDLRGMVQRIAALLTLRPLLDGAYEKAAAQSWVIDDFGPVSQSSPDAATSDTKSF